SLCSGNGEGQPTKTLESYIGPVGCSLNTPCSRYKCCRFSRRNEFRNPKVKCAVNIREDSGLTSHKIVIIPHSDMHKPLIIRINRYRALGRHIHVKKVLRPMERIVIVRVSQIDV